MEIEYIVIAKVDGQIVYRNEDAIAEVAKKRIDQARVEVDKFIELEYDQQERLEGSFA
jgi:hypothetical protein